MRKELKYYISEHQAEILYRLLRCFCDQDSHYNGDYNVKSLYFDTYHNKLLHEKVDGLDRLGKVRIRIYNDNTSEIKLELKRKKGAYVSKESILIDQKTYHLILQDTRLLNTYFKHCEPLLKPKIIVNYDRKALNYRGSDLRITFDRQIRTSIGVPDIYKDQLYANSYDQSVVVLELKYSHEIPIHIKHVLLDMGLEDSISKYVIARTRI